VADDLITFDENISRDILKMRDEWRRRGTASKRTRRQPIMDAKDGGRNWSSYGGIPYAGPWPCAEQACLKIPGITTPIIPTSYGFWPGLMDCDCTDNLEHDAVELLDTDNADIYRSTEIECPGTIYDHESCTNTVTWVWTIPTCDSSQCQYRAAESGSGFVWVLENNECCAGQICDLYAASLDTPPGNINDVLNVPCVSRGDGSEGSWSILSQTNPTCNCTPVQPDVAGVADGDTTTTQCTGTGSSTGEVGLQESYWELTIVPTLDEFDHDLTNLKFYIGETVVREYYLDGKRPFCRQCINTFRIKSCGPTDCDYNPPPILCLYPNTESTVIPGTPLSCCDADASGGIPRFITVEITDTSSWSNSACSNDCEADFLGTYLLEWDDINRWWAYYFYPSDVNLGSVPDCYTNSTTIWKVLYSVRVVPCDGDTCLCGIGGLAANCARLSIITLKFSDAAHTTGMIEDDCGTCSTAQGDGCGTMTFTGATVTPITGSLLQA